jgi:hypothetical protein
LQKLLLTIRYNINPSLHIFILWLFCGCKCFSAFDLLWQSVWNIMQVFFCGLHQKIMFAAVFFNENIIVKILSWYQLTVDTNVGQ